MAYTETNYKTKKAMREAVDASATGGPPVRVFQPGPFGPEVKNGPVAIEGPHYPAAHSWYASARVEDGAIVPGTVR